MTWETVAHQEDSNEYAAELLAIRQALRILVWQQQEDLPKEVTICTDCQSAILSIQNPRHQSGQHFIRVILRLANRLQAKGMKLTLQWVPAHQGVEGNEIAHWYAHLATRKQWYAPAIDEKQFRLKSTALRVGREAILATRDATFQKEDFGKQIRKLDQALPRDHMVKIYNTMTQEDVKILVQLRTGHVGLNSYLYRVKKTDSAACECGMGEETVAHFLFLCPRWVNERQDLRHILQDRWADLSYTLGGWSSRKDTINGKLIDGRKDQWKPNITVLRAVIQFVKATQRLQPKVIAENEE